jgi:hypothetical protein
MPANRLRTYQSAEQTFGPVGWCPRTVVVPNLSNLTEPSAKAN